MADSLAPMVPERNVFFEPPHYSPDQIEAVLSDGTHLMAEYQLEANDSNSPARCPSERASC